MRIEMRVNAHDETVRQAAMGLSLARARVLLNAHEHEHAPARGSAGASGRRKVAKISASNLSREVADIELTGLVSCSVVN
ncbi:hypothetical protein WS62_13165 [Burkholderia sp. ABCPW 14]|nr:hypothetical protein WS62_13165 [Burkholderia sp. ABCPW 14]